MLSSCGGDILVHQIIHGHPFKSRWQQERERLERMKQGKDVLRALRAEDVQFPCATTVVTDSGSFDFRAHFAGICTVDGTRYLHGSADTRDGYGLEYRAIPFPRLRSVTFDWPIRLLLADRSEVRFEEGAWRAVYADGALLAYAFNRDTDGGAVRDTISAEDVMLVMDGHSER